MSSQDEKPKNENHKAINRAKDQIKILEGTVHKQGHKITNLEKENNQLKKEIERLKKELAAKKVIPKWVKPNKDKTKKSKKSKSSRIPAF